MTVNQLAMPSQVRVLLLPPSPFFLMFSHFLGAKPNVYGMTS